MAGGSARRDDTRYVSHARRADVMRQDADSEPARQYWAGYRVGMIAALAESEDALADDAEHQARDDLAERALRGEERDPSRAAWGCGYHDGQRWSDPRQHRGLLRLVIETQGGGSVRGTALGLLDVDDSSVRQMLAGTRTVPPQVHAALLDALLLPKSSTSTTLTR